LIRGEKNAGSVERLELLVPVAAVVLVSRHEVSSRLVVFEVAHVLGTLDRGDVGSDEFLLLEHVPVEALEPRALLYLGGLALDHAQALRRLMLQEIADDGFGLRGEVRGELVAAADDLVVHFELVLVVEGGVAGHHLVDQNAHRPPIHALAVALTRHDFGAEVLGGPAQRPRLVGDLLGESEVGDLDVALRVEEQILGLEVSVDGVFAVPCLRMY
jgi:hypothetical protein